ncbi:hypothetical protein PLESTF_001464400 [Pleodorina starrii]|nr:hypothetical protein PLESTM_000420900 [Pleodorina starrii]GLC74123.1 hypothetical protein PLESTF_001464400 [Pleodorina starrii]
MHARAHAVQLNEHHRYHTGEPHPAAELRLTALLCTALHLLPPERWRVAVEVLGAVAVVAVLGGPNARRRDEALLAPAGNVTVRWVAMGRLAPGLGWVGLRMGRFCSNAIYVRACCCS